MTHPTLYSGSEVGFIRDELREIMPRYELIHDCLEGEYAIKAKNKEYLPIPNSEKNDVASARYQEYLLRAVFYNVTQRTAEGLVGQIFLRPPTVELPTKLEAMVENINGEGLTLNQLAKQASGHLLPYGRGGFLSDYPQTNGSVTKEEMATGNIQPTIKFYETWDMINWETKIINNKKVLTMLVLREFFEEREEGTYQVLKYEQYRVLERTEHGVTVTVHYEQTDDDSTDNFASEGASYLMKSDGTPFTEIPFSFIGSENNDVEIDIPPLYTMAVLNIAHYRNSADYEENVYFMGQPTPFISGLTEDWVRDVLGGEVLFGARAVIPGPVGSDAKLLQVQPNTLAKEAMDQKEQQMISVGAKLVERESNVERKEKEIEIEAASDVSILTKIATNVESAMIRAFGFCADFVGADVSGLKFDINKNFDLTSLTAEEIRQLNEIVNSEVPLLAFSEIRRILDRSGYTYLTTEEAIKEIQAEMKQKIEYSKQMTVATTPPPAPVSTPIGGNPPAQ